jgi:hypothetical protein
VSERKHHQAFTRGELIGAFLALSGAAVLLYTFGWVVDFGLNWGQAPWELFVLPGAASTLTNFGEVTVGVLAVSLTVVTIIVELASNRYTPRITELFLRDPINALVLSFFVVSAVFIVWVDMSLYGMVWPSFMAGTSVVLMSLNLLMLLPYFAYVFDFLLPNRVVGRIEKSSARAIRRVARGARSVNGARHDVRIAVEQLGDVALNSVDKKDKAIAFAAIASLEEVAKEEIIQKKSLPDAWFATTDLGTEDQDFVALHPAMVRVLEARRTWLLTKILRQYQVAFGEAVNEMRDVNHLLAIHTRRLAQTAADHHDEPALEQCIRFFNTYLRASINARDVRTAYNVLNEYRVLAEHLLRLGRADVVVTLAQRAKFYGQLGFAVQIPFVLETVAYDMATLLERAWETQASCHDALLDVLLDVDREARVDTQERSLRGVRKAQAKLATFYLGHGAEHHARRIARDMEHETHERLSAICQELESVTEQEYWEVSDRGVHFDYLPPDRRPHLRTFLGWLPAWRAP